MQTKDKRLLSALQRVQGFLDVHASQFASVNQSATRARLDAVIELLTRLGLQQDPTKFQRREEQELERRQRLDIRNTWMKPIASIAHAAFPVTDREFREFRLPREGVDVVAFILSARGMAAAAGEHAPQFVDSGLPPDFVAQFSRATDALQHAVANRERNRSARVGATARLKDAAAEGRGLVRIVNSLISPVLESDAHIRADWERTKNVASRSAPADAAPPEVQPSATASE